MNPAQQVHFLLAALQAGYDQATKFLPRGYTQSPVPWCSPELIQLMDQCNKAWIHANELNHSLDWALFDEYAMNLRNEAHKASRDYWMQFCESLSYTTEPSEVSQIADSLQGIHHSWNIQNIVKDPITSKPCTTDAEKANAFKNQYASVCKKPTHPIHTEHHEYHNHKEQAAKYASSAEHANDPDAQPFTCHELQAAIWQLQSKCTPGPDHIFNHFLKHTSSAL